MSKDILVPGGPGSEEDYFRKFADNLRKSGEKLKEVRSAAIGLAAKHPDKFSVTVVRGDDLVNITAITEFDVRLSDGTQNFILSLDVTQKREGGIVNEVMIYQPDKPWTVEDRISYRLDISQGQAVDAQHQRISGLGTDKRVDSQIWQGWLDGNFENSPDGQLSSITDNFAESTISSDSALYLLKSAKNLRRPKEYGYVSGISLKQLREIQRKSSAGKGHTPLLGE